MIRPVLVLSLSSLALSACAATQQGRFTPGARIAIGVMTRTP